MKIAIMQPYIFPYIGYFQLIHSVDKFVIYDDVQFIKGGWINRNYIVVNGNKFMFNLILHGASSNKNINQIQVSRNKTKLSKTIEYNYRNAPFFKTTAPLIFPIIEDKEENLALFISNSIIEICKYLQIETQILYSSNLHKDNTLKGKEKVIHICKTLNANTYINAIGGQQLYSKDEFAQNNIDLRFVQTEEINYHQNSNKFIPNLSIIDVLMHNGKEGTIELLKKYTLV